MRYISQQTECKTVKIPTMHLGLGLTFPLGLKEAQQVVAGLLQQDIVVSLVRAVWIIVTTEVTKTVHWQNRGKKSVRVEKE